MFYMFRGCMGFIILRKLRWWIVIFLYVFKFNKEVCMNVIVMLNNVIMKWSMLMVVLLWGF